MQNTSSKVPSNPKPKSILQYIWSILLATLPTTPKANSLQYRHESDAFVLQNSRFFVSLLEEIRSHLLCSETTRAVYVLMAKRFYSTLPADVQAVIDEPTDKAFFSYIYSNWPTFNSFKPHSPNRIIWGIVWKGNGEPNEVSILSNIVKSANSAAIASCDHPHNISMDQYKLVLTIIILHELSHAFTKFQFTKLDMPLGVDPDKKHGESGWLVEDELMGGRIAVEWNDQLKFGDMDSIDRVILTSGSESWVIDDNEARNIVSSLSTPTLHAPAKASLIAHNVPVGSAQARISESTRNPVPREEAPTVGPLGFTNMSGPFISYIGNDKM